MRLSSLFGSILSATALLSMAGCGEDTGHSGQPQFNPDYDASGSSAYSGQIMDGYIRGATLWIDLNGNKTLDDGEPTTTSGAQGRFSFSQEDLMVPDGSGNDVPLSRPKAYPLLALVTPDCIDEDTGTNIDRTFLLMAPPTSGHVARIISPYSTLLMAQLDLQNLDNGHGPGDDDDTEKAAYEAVSDVDLDAQLNDLHNTVRTKLGINANLLVDYILKDDPQLHLYAQALTRSLQDYAESEFGGDIASATETNLESMSRAFVNQGSRVIDAVDTAVGSTSKEAYRSVSLSSVASVNLVVLENDPLMISRENIYLDPATYAAGGEVIFSGTFFDASVIPSADKLAQSQTYLYNTGGIVQRIQVFGDLPVWRRDYLVSYPLVTTAWFPENWTFERLVLSDNPPASAQIDLTVGATAIDYAVDFSPAKGEAPDGVVEEAWQAIYQAFSFGNGNKAMPVQETYPDANMDIAYTIDTTEHRITEKLFSGHDDSLNKYRWSYDYEVSAEKRLNKINISEFDASSAESAFAEINVGYLAATSHLVQKEQFLFQNPALQSYCMIRSYDSYQKLAKVYVQLAEGTSCKAGQVVMMITYEYKRLSELLAE